MYNQKWVKKGEPNFEKKLITRVKILVYLIVYISLLRCYGNAKF